MAWFKIESGRFDIIYDFTSNQENGLKHIQTVYRLSYFELLVFMRQ